MNEPVRKSYFDLIKANMAAAKRNQFITRLVYFGMYYGTEEYLRKKFEIVMKYLRSEYSELRVTGMLLIYPHYFVHVIEAPEELILRHLEAIFSDEIMKINLGRVLPLPLYHHVHKCFFPRWLTLFTKPPELLDKLEGTGTAEIQKQLSNCLLKVYTLCEYISSHVTAKRGSVDEVLKSLSDENDQRYLPESTLIEFLLKSKSPILRDIREFVEMAKAVPHMKLYNEIIWPPVCDFMPHEVFVEHASRRDLMLRRLTSKRQNH